MRCSGERNAATAFVKYALRDEQNVEEAEERRGEEVAVIRSSVSTKV